ncbi:MAG: hypothetical protein QW778_03530 [Candidatus Micrarchaeaceae archaeon]
MAENIPYQGYFWEYMPLAQESSREKSIEKDRKTVRNPNIPRVRVDIFATISTFFLNFIN